ncbi:hypothetical protein CR513_48710, partial [Mucuna pruriens]
NNLSTTTTTSFSIPNVDNAQKRRSNPTRAFAPIPMTYIELLTHLIQNSLVVPFPLKPLQPPYPKNYDLNVKCDYHTSTIEKGLNTGSNLLLDHNGTLVNVIENN